MSANRSEDRERAFFSIFFRSTSTEITDAEVAYFREHPEEIDEFTAPVNVHKTFLWLGALFGTICVALSKVLKYASFFDFLPGVVAEFLVDIVFEIGVALIGAAVTAFILGILLNQQQESAANWRAEIWRRIDNSKSE